MPYCAVKWCINHSGKHNKKDGITFHIFPTNPERKEIWTKAVRNERQDPEWLPNKASKICSLHFKEDDLYPTNKGNTNLKKSAIPICTMVFSNVLNDNEKDGNKEKDRNTAKRAKIDIENVEPVKESQGVKQSREKPVLSSWPKLIDVQMYSLNNDCKQNTCQGQDLNEIPPGSRKRRMVSCPSCECEFGLIEAPPARTTFTQRKPDNERCVTPFNIPSSDTDIQSALNTPKSHNRQQLIKKKTILSKKRLSKIKSLQRRNARLLKHCISLKDVTRDLKNNKLIKTSLSETSISDVAQDIWSNINKKQAASAKGKMTITKFTPALKKFALTLHNYSPSAYKYVRRQFHSCLPHPSTLNNWYRTVDCEPGFTEESFRAVKSKFEHTDKNLACLIVDEMAIRQQKIFNGKNMDGLVSHDDSDEIATQAYVFMLVSLNDSWKLPLGYFLMNGISAIQRANMIKMCLTKCYEAGAQVVSLTFDGCASNLSSAKVLGCNFSHPADLKTTFPHPSTNHPIAVILDPCHMVKLVRNTFESKRAFTDNNEQVVHWRYVQELKKVQDNLGLHFANKLTERHLNFRNNIMSVKLATQLFSNSVAKAIEFCDEVLKIPEFQDSMATVNFIKIMNNLFDVLNAYSLEGKGFKHPASLKDGKDLFGFLDSAKDYLLGLTIKVRNKRTQMVNGKKILHITTTEKKVTETQVKTGVLGLLVCIESIKHIFNDLVVEKMMLRFILPYKFSQDHIEMFFGVIRNHGRCNNNPNARQFKGIYKKTLLNLELRSNFTGNCIPLADIPILNCAKKINETSKGFRSDSSESENEDHVNVNDTVCEQNCDVFSDMLDYELSLPDTVDQVIGYIAGFVAKKIKAKVDCEHCRRILMADEKYYFHQLICLKDFDGLAYPSVALFKMCLKSETVLSHIIKTNNGKSLTNKQNLAFIANKCFAYVSTFKDVINAFETNSCCHNFLLVKSAIEHFLVLRLHYIAKKDSLINSTRQKLNKVTLFRGT